MGQLKSIRTNWMNSYILWSPLLIWSLIALLIPQLRPGNNLALLCLIASLIMGLFTGFVSNIKQQVGKELGEVFLFYLTLLTTASISLILTPKTIDAILAVMPRPISIINQTHEYLLSGKFAIAFIILLIITLITSSISADNRGKSDYSNIASGISGCFVGGVGGCAIISAFGWDVESLSTALIFSPILLGLLYKKLPTIIDLTLCVAVGGGFYQLIQYFDLQPSVTDLSKIGQFLIFSISFIVLWVSMSFLRMIFMTIDKPNSEPLNQSSIKTPRKNRPVVHVFISSTFRDMQAERDELAKVTFPELKAFCRMRQVDFIEVDLRWGVTEEQSRRGETLRLCLKDIQLCRPYFIGLLGERYGWTPVQFSADDRADYPWINECQGRSITELEIMHGVLNDPEMARRASFYFRDPAYSKAHGTDFTSESPQSAEKLSNLKERIRQSGLPLVENYPDPQTVARQIGEYLRAAIETEYPANPEPVDPLDREAEDHAAFAASRARVYIGRTDYFQRLEAFIQQEVAPDDTSTALLVTGESGIGKSALLSNWAHHHQENHPGNFLLLHFIGSTPASADYETLIRRIMGELKRSFGLKDNLPGETKALVRAFPNWLSIAAAKDRGKKLILILDGLNQLEDRDASAELGWLPEFFPANVRIIISTLPGVSLEAMQRRQHIEFCVAPLTQSERAELIVKYLAQFRRALDKDPLERLAAAPACANPLYLRVLLDELRLFGLNEKLSERILFYQEAETIEVLYQKVLDRLETDYDPARRGVWNPPASFSRSMVAEVLCLIWAARRGLSESELLDLLGNPPRAAWSPIYHALVEALVERRGVLNFFHDYLRQAVEKRYLADAESQKAVRLKLGKYFKQRLDIGRAAPGIPLNPRTLDELPWLWRMAEDWPDLYDLLANLEVMDALWQIDPYEVKLCWTTIENHSSYRLETTYQKILLNPKSYDYQKLWSLTMLMSDKGFRKEALKLREYMTEQLRSTKDLYNLQASIGNQGLLLQELGSLDEALILFIEQENICRKAKIIEGLSNSLGNQGLIQRIRGKFTQALRLFEEQEQLSRKTNNMIGLSHSLNNQGIVYKTIGDINKALSCYKEDERICRQSGDMTGFATSLGNQGNILKDTGKLDEALLLYKQEEECYRKYGHLSGLQRSLGNQGLVYEAKGALDRAFDLYQQKLEISKKINDLPGMANAYINQGNIYNERGDLLTALAFFQKAKTIFDQLDDKVGKSKALNGEGMLNAKWQFKNKALTLFIEAEMLDRQSNNTLGLIDSLGNKAAVLSELNRYAEALPIFVEVEALCKKIGDQDRLQRTMCNIGVIYVNLGRINEARLYFFQAEQICRAYGFQQGLDKCLRFQDNLKNII